MKKYFLLLLLYAVSFITVSQNKDIDSVLNLLKTAKADTNQVKNLNNLSWYYMDESNFDESLKYAQQALTLAKSIQYKQGQVISLSYIALTYHARNDFASALNYFYQEQKEYETFDNKKSQAKNLSNTGNVFSDKGDYIKALDFYFQSLKINEAIKYREGIASNYNNIGIVYSYQSNYDKTLEFFFKALQINTELKRQRGIVNALGNIGNIYFLQHKYGKALEYHFKALKMNEASGNKNGLSDNYGNIAITYNDQSDADFIAQGLKPEDRFKLSTQYSFKALKLNEELKNQYGLAVNYLNIGAAYLKTNKFTDAETYCLKGLTLAKTDGYLELVKEGAQKLSDVYQNLNNQKKALEYFKMYITSRDSLQNEENTKKTVRLEMNYEFDKKEAAAKLEQEKIAAIAAADSRRQKVIIYSIIGILLLVLAFAVFAYRSYLQKQKANIEITHQKDIIEEKQKEILDSIHYAKRIQRAVITSDNYIAQHLKNYFIFYQPKDIVSGDFYWALNYDDKFYIATADCTGHGVPGAFMSLLNISILNEVMIEKKITRPDLILNEARKDIIKSLNPTGSEESKDGMDCILACFDFKNLTLEYAAANNAFYIVRNNELLICAANKMPVGKSPRDTEAFTLHTVNLQPGDTVYMLTDGLPDQFGGPKGKKFKYKQLEDILVANTNKPLDEQKNILEHSFNTWKGNLEQVDDVLLIAVKV